MIFRAKKILRFARFAVAAAALFAVSAQAQQPALSFRLEPDLPEYFIGQQVTGLLTVDAGGYELDGNTRLSDFVSPADAIRYGAFKQRNSGNPRLTVYATPIVLLREGEPVFAPAIDGQVSITEMRGIFQSRRIMPFKAAAAPLGVKVRTLPRETQPPEFSGAVGVFTLDASLEPRVCSPGDVLSLRWLLAGESAFDAPKDVKYSAGAEFRIYPPTTDPASAPGALVCSQDVIPMSTNATSAAALEICVFNPVKQIYETLRAGPFPLEISERAPGVSALAPTLDYTEKTRPENVGATNAKSFPFAGLFTRKRGESLTAVFGGDAKLLPDTRSKTLFEIPPGSVLEIRERKDDWIFVLFDGASGWMKAPLTNNAK